MTRCPSNRDRNGIQTPDLLRYVKQTSQHSWKKANERKETEKKTHFLKVQISKLKEKVYGLKENNMIGI